MLISRKWLEQYMDISDLSMEEIADKVTSINIADGSDYQIYMKDESKIVHLGTIDNIDTKMLYVKAIVEKEKGNDGEIFVNMDLNKKDPYFRQNV